MEKDDVAWTLQKMKREELESFSYLAYTHFKGMRMVLDFKIALEQLKSKKEIKEVMPLLSEALKIPDYVSWKESSDYDLSY
jgi:predicted CopG family antitoxin